MNETTKRRALMAASKVTFSAMVVGVTTSAALFGLVACGDDEAGVPVGERDGTQAGNETNGKQQAKNDPPAAAATSTTPQKDPPPKNEPPPKKEPPVATCDDFACCNAKVGPILDEEDGFQWEDEKIAAIKAKLGPDGIACCVTLLEHSETQPNADRSPDHWACCSAAADLIKPEATLACTPWGPPTPPSFDDVAFAVSLLQVVA